jgi:hypothetical protein
MWYVYLCVSEVNMEQVYMIELVHAGLSSLQSNVIRSRFNEKDLQARGKIATGVLITHQSVSFGVRAETAEDARLLGSRVWNKIALDAKRCGRGEWPFKGVAVKHQIEILLQEEWF